MIMDIVNSKIEGKVLEAYYNEELKEYTYIVEGPNNCYLLWMDNYCECHMSYWNPRMGFKEYIKKKNLRELHYDRAKIDCDIEVANNEEDTFVVKELILSKGDFHNIVFKDKGIHSLGWR